MSETDYREKCLSQKPNACQVCEDTENIVVHHIDADRDNNSLDNLVPLCKSCHSRLHTKKATAGSLKELQEQLPEFSLAFTDEKSPNPDRRVSIKASRELYEELKDAKPDRETWGRYLERQCLEDDTNE